MTGMVTRLLAATALAASMAGAGFAQDARAQTLADVRQDLTVLHVEVQRLKRELSTTGASQAQVGGAGMLDRVGSIEGELQRLTGTIEQLEFRIDQIVRDGTNRIGDLEFRLVELEGGDVSALGQTTTLGGGALTGAAPAQPLAGQGLGTDATGSQLAVGEQADFDSAKSALDSGDGATAAEGFALFTQNYPGSPLETQARLLQGQAHEQAGNPREAARAYLEAYSGDPSGVDAPQALFHLGRALGRLGKISEACVTLGEVTLRHPGTQAASEAQAQMADFNCA